MKTIRYPACGLAFSLALAVACSDDKPVKPAGDLVAVGGGAGAAGKTQSTPTCPEGRGPSMIAITLPDMPAYCIDTTEVTQGQYAVFAGDKTVDLGKQATELCRKYNHELVAPIAQHQVKGCPAGVYVPAEKPDVPVSCVDWCDASAFCAWAGKRLCGGAGGTPLSTAADAGSPKSEWYLACSQGGKTKYPYGNELVRGKCDTSEKFELSPASARDCHGETEPFAQLSDLSGSVSEWVNACQGEEAPACAILGGFGSTGETWMLACDGAASFAALPLQGGINPAVGFRCCADPVQP